MTRRILVVDDDPSVGRTVERALKAMGYDALSVVDPRCAYELLESGDFDLVLLDVNMPQMSGDALFLALIRRSPELATRVILMSGNPWAKDDWPIELQCCPLLGKPFTLEGLALSVSQTLSAADQHAPRRKRNGG